MISGLLRYSAAALFYSALIGAAGAQESYNARSSAPTGTQTDVVGNPNCPPPVINGITPKNWSCKTGEGSSYTLPQTSSVRPPPNYGPPGSYIQPQPGPPGSYLQKDVGPPGSYIQPDVGPPGSYLNSTGGTQVHTSPSGAIILTPGTNPKPGPNNAARNGQIPTPGVNAPYRQDTQSMQPSMPQGYNGGGYQQNATPYRQDTGAMQGGRYSDGGGYQQNGSPYRQDTGAMQGGVTSNGYSFGPQNSTTQAVQGLAGLIGNGLAVAAQTSTVKTSAKTSAAKSAAAKRAQAAAANAQAAQVMNGFIKMLGTEPGAP